MRTLGIIVACLALLVGGAIAWWMINYPTYSYRYRMIVDVLSGGAVHSGASVIAVRVDKQPQFGSAPPQVSRVDGEAAFVDLGRGRNVIALLAAGPQAKDGDYPYNVVPTLFGLTFADRDLAKLPGLRGRREVPANFLPTFMTFTDLNDAATAREIKPEEFEQVFGPGVQLRSVVVEMTAAPTTREIAQRMPWWDKPMPWLTRSAGGSTYFDNRPDGSFRWHNGHLKRDY